MEWRMNGIDEFVLRGGQTVTAGQMSAFQRKLALVKVKAEELDSTDLPRLKGQAQFLVRFAEDVLDGTYACTDLQAIAETVFALGYLLKDVDIIPDTVPGKGLVDDAAVLCAVLRSHAGEFKAFAAASATDYAAIAPES